jgi:hypothetical protein
MNEIEYINKFKNILYKKRALNICITDDEMIKYGFVEVKKIESVNINFKKGISEFIKTYFDSNKVIKDDITTDEENNIIQKLFINGIASKIDDETGYLIIDYLN